LFSLVRMPSRWRIQFPAHMSAVCHIMEDLMKCVATNRLRVIWENRKQRGMEVEVRVNKSMILVHCDWLDLARMNDVGCLSAFLGCR
jgi:NADPH-dependent 7-cyano-7-deazaguanine reductase QueF